MDDVVGVVAVVVVVVIVGRIVDVLEVKKVFAGVVEVASMSVFSELLTYSKSFWLY